jgi:hypothetical protein
MIIQRFQMSGCSWSIIPLRPNWTRARAITFQVKPDRATRLSISFADQNHVAFTTWIDLPDTTWQTVRVDLDEIRPNPFFQPPGAAVGKPKDLSEVNALGFAPQDRAAGRIVIGKIVLVQPAQSNGDRPRAVASGSHRVRTAGIVGASLGLTAGITGANMMGWSDNEGWARGVTYLGASGAVAGWIAGTVVALPFRGHNAIGPNDVRNARITGGAVGFMTGVAAGSLVGFKCAKGCSASTSPIMTIAATCLIAGFVGAAIGHGIGMALSH